MSIPHAAEAARPQSVARSLARRPTALAALAYLVLVVAAALLAPVLSLDSPTDGDLTDSLQGPSGAHWLGTDQTGRDTLSRLVWGARPTLMYAGEAVAVALIIGVALGVLAGFVRGRTDNVLGAMTDVVMAMPGMVILLVVLAIFGNRMNLAMIALGVLLFAPFMRVVRAATLAVRAEVFIDAARVAGLSTWRIMLRHILPRIGGAVMVQGSLLAGMALLLSTGVAYLGFGTQPPNPSWGLMIGDGAQIMGDDPTLLIASGAAIGLTVIALGLLGDGLRDATTQRWNTARASRAKPGRPAPIAISANAVPHTQAMADSGDPDAVLRIQDLSVGYTVGGHERIVVHGVSLHIRAGETLGVVGESGSSKTAIARAVLGILDGGRVTGGQIFFEDRDITGIAGLSPQRRATLHIGHIFQSPHGSLDPTWRVGSLVAEVVRRHQGISRKAAWQAAIDLLGQVRLEDPAAVARRYPHELSGGMAQRVAIARALASNPRLLVADEPTTALDVTVQAEILDLLHGVQERTDMAILLITHDWGVVADLCDRAVVLRDGRILEHGAVDTLYADAQHEYTRSLLASNPATLLAGVGGEGARQ